MSSFENKLVAVVNNKVEPGKSMNALAHMCIGIGAAIDKESLRLTNYQDADGGSHPNISEMPFIILAANSNKIRTLRNEAIAKGLLYTDFTDKMTIGGYEEQLAASSATKEQDLSYLGIVLFGEWDQVGALTRKFSLWR